MTATESPAYRQSVLLMLCSVLLFSVNVLIIRGLALHAPLVDGWLATLFRGAVGLIVVTMLYARRGLQWGNLIGRPLVMARGVLGAIGIIAYYITVVELGAARATVLNLTYPMFAAVIAAVWLREYLGLRAIIWLAVGFCGLLIFLSDGAFKLGVSGYDVLALVGALAAGYVVVVIRQLRHSEHPATIYAAQCVFSLLVALVPSSPAALHLGWIPLLVLVIAGVVVSFGQLCMTQIPGHPSKPGERHPDAHADCHGHGGVFDLWRAVHRSGTGGRGRHAGGHMADCPAAQHPHAIGPRGARSGIIRCRALHSASHDDPVAPIKPFLIQ